MNIKDVKIKPEIFKSKREEAGLTVREVEEKTGVSRSSISSIESGITMPDGKNLLRLMFFFELSKEDIALSE